MWVQRHLCLIIFCIRLIRVYPLPTAIKPWLIGLTGWTVGTQWRMEGMPLLRYPYWGASRGISTNSLTIVLKHHSMKRHSKCFLHTTLPYHRVLFCGPTAGATFQSLRYPKQRTLHCAWSVFGATVGHKTGTITFCLLPWGHGEFSKLTRIKKTQKLLQNECI